MDKKNSYRIIILICITVSVVLVSFNKNIDSGKKKVNYKYHLYMPDDYQKKSRKKFPLIIYLHGASLRGTDLNLVKKYGIPYLTDKGEKFDFIIASPHCPPKKYWDSENWFDNLYDELTSRYRIDTKRIYLTGMSMGGFGTWNLAMEYPEKFAAIVPLCGGGNEANVCRIKNIPVWVFHGTSDDVVPITRSETLVNKLRQCGGNVKFTRLKGKGHSIQWVYEDEKIYSWMLRHSRE